MGNAFNKLIRSNIFLCALTLIAVVLMSTAVTYALFQVDDYNTENQVISIGTLDAQLSSTSGTILISDIYPTAQSDLTTNENTYSFTISNTGDYDLNYTIYLADNTSSFLSSNTGYSSYTALSSTYYQYIDISFDSGTATNFSEIYNSSSGYRELLTGTISSGNSEDHTIQFWLDESAPNDINGTILALTVNLVATAIES